MKLVIKRPIWPYATHVLLIGLCIFSLTKNSSEVRLFLWTFLIIVVITSFILLLIKRNYFELTTDNRLLIRIGILSTKTINMLEIDKVEIESSFFRASRIILKDKSQINFDSSIGKEELKKLLGRFDIPVN